MNTKMRIAYLRVGYCVLPFLLLLVGCTPGPSVYEGSLEKKNSIILKEGKEYFVCIEYKKSGVRMLIPFYSSAGGSSRNYPILNEIVAIHDEMGNTISNTIMSSSFRTYVWCSFGFGRAGIPVAKFRLAGKDSRSIEISVNMTAYKDFAIKYNRRGGVEYDETFAPSKPNTITIREAGKLPLGTWFVVAILLIAFLAILYRQQEKEEH